MCGSIRAGPSARCAARRSRCRVPSSGACPPWPVRNGGKRSATACSSTTTRTPRIGPRARRIRCARSPTPACPRRFTGTRFPTASPADFTILTMPNRFEEIGDPHAGMNAAPGSLEKLLELAAKDEAAGLADAPWPPHFRKMEGEAPRVAPSRAKSAAQKPPRTKMPLVVVANSPDKKRCAGGPGKMEKQTSRRRPALLAVDDVLVDSMRGRSSTWTRIRVNLRHVPEALRPPQETPDPDDDPTREWRNGAPSDVPSVTCLRRKSPPTPAAAPLRAGHTCSRSASCPCATFENAPCAGSGRPACAHTRLRPPARAAAAPTKVFALAPAALATRHAMPGFPFCGRILRPLLPRMIGERILAIRREEFYQLHGASRR